MKKLTIVLALVLLSFTISWAATPDNNSIIKAATTATVSADHSATTWTAVDSLIVIKTDTCYTLYTLTGTATMDPWDVLYIGIHDGGAVTTAVPSTDTLVVYPPNRPGTIGPQTVEFGFTYLDSLISQTDANDSIYVTAAVRGNTTVEQVALSSVILSAAVVDKD